MFTVDAHFSSLKSLLILTVVHVHYWLMFNTYDAYLQLLSLKLEGILFVDANLDENSVGC